MPRDYGKNKIPLELNFLSAIMAQLQQANLGTLYDPQYDRLRPKRS